MHMHAQENRSRHITLSTMQKSLDIAILNNLQMRYGMFLYLTIVSLSTVLFNKSIFCISKATN